MSTVMVPQSNVENPIELQSAGAVCRLRIRVWQGKKRVKRGDKVDLIHTDGNLAYFSAMKRLVDPNSLKPIFNVAQKARLYVYDFALPLNISGFHYVEANLIPQVQENLERMRDEFYSYVNPFCSQFDSLRESCKQHLGSQFNVDDYPDDIRNCFQFSWSWRAFTGMEQAENLNGVVSAELLQQSMNETRREIEGIQDNWKNLIASKFNELVTYALERIRLDENGQGKKFKSNTIANVENFLDVMSNYESILNSNDLSSIAGELRQAINGVDGKAIRSSEEIRQQVIDSFDKAKDNLDTFLENRPKRALDLD